VEHVLNTSGDSYMSTPEDDLSLFVLYGWDVAAAFSFILLVLFGAVVLLWNRFKNRTRSNRGLSNAQQPLYPAYSGVTARINLAASAKSKDS
jgi:hypothetical protein